MSIIEAGYESPHPSALVIQRIAAHAAEAGGMCRRNVLPSREKCAIGAWCFLDLAEPMDDGADTVMHVGPHPHVGLQALTWVIEGEILHRDSLGNEQIIRPGQVNLMTAGGGITHAEETPTGHASRIRAAQLWIALPDALRHCAPTFEHYAELPRLARGGFNMTLFVGHLFGEQSPVQVHSPLLGLDLVTNGAAKTTIPLRGDFEYGVLVLEGEATIAGERLTPGVLLYLGGHRTRIDICCDGPASLLLIGGEPMHEMPLLWWNFVARRHEEIVEFRRLWNAGEHFGDVHGFNGSRITAPAMPTGLRVLT